MSPLPDAIHPEPQRSVATGFSRMGSALRRHGLAGSLRLAASRAGQLAYVRRAHVWYWLRLTADVRRRLGQGPRLELIRGGEREWGLVEPFPRIGLHEARRRLAAGTDLWFVIDERQSVLSCWVHRALMPGVDGRRYLLRLPPGTVGLENAAVTDPALVQGPSPLAWAFMACMLASEGADGILTRADETNLPGRRAIESAGFRAVASMQVERIGIRWRVALRPYASGGIGMVLAEQFRR